MTRHQLNTEKFEYNRSNKPLYFAIALLIIAILGLGYFLLFTDQGQELLNRQNSLAQQNQQENIDSESGPNDKPNTDNIPIVDFEADNSDQIIDEVTEKVLTTPKSEEVDGLTDIDGADEFDT